MLFTYYVYFTLNTCRVGGDSAMPCMHMFATRLCHMDRCARRLALYYQHVAVLGMSFDEESCNAAPARSSPIDSPFGGAWLSTWTTVSSARAVTRLWPTLLQCTCMLCTITCVFASKRNLHIEYVQIRLHDSASGIIHASGECLHHVKLSAHRSLCMLEGLL